MGTGPLGNVLREMLEQKLVSKLTTFDTGEVKDQTLFLLESRPGPVWMNEETGEVMETRERPVVMSRLPARICQRISLVWSGKVLIGGRLGLRT